MGGLNGRQCSPIDLRLFHLAWSYMLCPVESSCARSFLSKRNRQQSLDMLRRLSIQVLIFTDISLHAKQRLYLCDWKLNIVLPPEEVLSGCHPPNILHLDCDCHHLRPFQLSPLNGRGWKWKSSIQYHHQEDLPYKAYLWHLREYLHPHEAVVVTLIFLYLRPKARVMPFYL
jgi:hypothetical protein